MLIRIFAESHCEPLGLFCCGKGRTRNRTTSIMTKIVESTPTLKRVLFDFSTLALTLPPADSFNLNYFPPDCLTVHLVWNRAGRSSQSLSWMLSQMTLMAEWSLSKSTLIRTMRVQSVNGISERERAYRRDLLPRSWRCGKTALLLLEKERIGDIIPRDAGEASVAHGYAMIGRQRR